MGDGSHCRGFDSLCLGSDLQDNDISQITDLTNSLPKGANDTAQSLLARLGCHDLDVELTPSIWAGHNPLNDTLFDTGVSTNNDGSDNLYTSHVPPKPSTIPMDVYGRVTQYNGNIVLQLRHFNQDTSYPMTVNECWLCKEKLIAGSQLYTHKHVLHGVFHVNDEFVQLDIDHVDLDRFIIPDNVLMPEEPNSLNDNHSFNIDTPVSQDTSKLLLDHYDKNMKFLNSNLMVDNEPSGSSSSGVVDPTYCSNSKISVPNNVINNPTTSDSLTSQTKNKGKLCISKHMPDLLPSVVCSENGESTNFSVQEHCFSTKKIHFSDSNKNAQSGNDRTNVHLSTNSTLSISQSITNNITDLHLALSDANKTERQLATANFNQFNDNISLEKETNPDDPEPILINKKLKSDLINSYQNDLPSNIRECKSGAKKRKSRPQKKLSVIQMTKDIVNSSQSDYDAVYIKEDLGLDSLNESNRSPSLESSEKEEINDIAKDLSDEDFDKKEEFSTVDKMTIAKNLELKCRKCGEKFDSVAFYTDHMKNHGLSDSELFYCHFCWKTFSKMSSLTSHTYTHTARKPFKCEFCNSSYFKEDKLRRHLLCKHMKEKPYKCTICCKSFVRKEYLKAHIGVHEGIKYKCDICSLECSTKFNLITHQDTHNRTLKCDLCEKTFAHDRDLKSHSETHTKAKLKFKCDVCDKEFTRKDALKRHHSVHLNKKFECNICKKSFSRKDRLSFHMKIHDNIKKFYCTQCEASFSRKEVLKKHEKTHNLSEKCHICSKAFSSKTKLLFHVIKHERENDRESKEAKYKCSLCSNVLKSKALLLKHVKIVHEAKREDTVNKTTLKPVKRMREFNCEFCSQTFSRNCILKSHINKVHKSPLTSNESSNINLYSKTISSSKHTKDRPNNLTNSLSVKEESTNPYLPINLSSDSLTPTNTSTAGSDISIPSCSAYSPVSSLHTPSRISETPADSALNLSTNAISAAFYLLTYPSYSSPY